MTLANFDIAGRLNLAFRRQRAGTKVFTFLNASNAAYDISDIPFQLNVKEDEYATTNLFQLTVGDGLTIDVNEMTVDVSEEQSDIRKELVYWELYNPTTKQTWLCGSAYFISREPKEGSDSIDVTVNLSSSVTVSVTSASVTNFKGGWSGAGNAFPTSPSVGDSYYLTQAATLASYGQSAVEWPAGTIAIYLGDDNWRLF